MYIAAIRNAHRRPGPAAAAVRPPPLLLPPRGADRDGDRPDLFRRLRGRTGRGRPDAAAAASGPREPLIGRSQLGLAAVQGTAAARRRAGVQFAAHGAGANAGRTQSSLPHPHRRQSDAGARRQRKRCDPAAPVRAARGLLDRCGVGQRDHRPVPAAAAAGALFGFDAPAPLLRCWPLLAGLAATLAFDLLKPLPAGAPPTRRRRWLNLEARATLHDRAARSRAATGVEEGRRGYASTATLQARARRRRGTSRRPSRSSAQAPRRRTRSSDGKRDGRGRVLLHLDSVSAQQAEEARGCDAGHGVHMLAGERRERPFRRTVESSRCHRHQLHRHLARARIAAIAYAEVDRRQPRRRFTQRSRRQPGEPLPKRR